MADPRLTYDSWTSPSNQTVSEGFAYTSPTTHKFPLAQGYARRIAFPGGIPKHAHAFSTSTDAAEGVLAVPEPLADLRRKRKGTRIDIWSLHTSRD